MHGNDPWSTAYETAALPLCYTGAELPVGLEPTTSILQVSRSTG